MKLTTIILIVVALCIGGYFMTVIARFFGIPPGLMLPLGIAFGTFVTIYVISYIKGLY
jgi:hypothetical protein